MKTIDHDLREKTPRLLKVVNVISWLVTAAICIPLAWYLKTHVQPQLGDWFQSFLH
ncbi:hypothetical protein [Rhizobium sp. HT1-10]|uniref:hypothetical protein n=1 Tax=Rhizobium sp. HT1-10 TaxID=3111638 RepID=UPI003C1C7172